MGISIYTILIRISMLIEFTYLIIELKMKHHN